MATDWITAIRGHVGTMAGTHWAAIVNDVAAVISAFVLLVGGVVARRYLRRANASITASLWEQTSGGAMLEVRPCVQSTGLKRLWFEDDEELRPQVRVTPVNPDGTAAGEATKKPCFDRDIAIDPGDIISESVIFPFRTVDPDQSWRVEFTFFVANSPLAPRKDFPWITWLKPEHRYRLWIATAFLAASPNRPE